MTSQPAFADIPAAPEPVSRPRLARFIWERGLTLKEAARPLGCSYEQLRLICLPFGHVDRRVPRDALLARIVNWTGGEITAADFYPPHLTGREPGGE